MIEGEIFSIGSKDKNSSLVGTLQKQNMMGSTNLTHPSAVMLQVVLETIGAVGLPGNLFLMFLIASEYKTRKPHDPRFPC